MFEYKQPEFLERLPKGTYTLQSLAVAGFVSLRTMRRWLKDMNLTVLQTKYTSKKKYAEFASESEKELEICWPGINMYKYLILKQEIKKVKKNVDVEQFIAEQKVKKKEEKKKAKR